MKPMRGLPFVVAGLCASLTACTVYEPSLLKQGGGQSTGGAPNLGPCDWSKKAPPKPNLPPDDGGSGDIELALLQYVIDLGDEKDSGNTRYRELGFDLDEKCTTSENKATSEGLACALPAYADGIVDGPGGTDNALGVIVQTVRGITETFNSGNYTKALQRGDSNVIVRVRGWNGEANDAQVQVDVYVAAPFTSFVPNADGGIVPQWDGTDVWPVASDSVLNGDVNQPRFSDALAYVSDYRVVASLPEASLRLDVGLSAELIVKLGMVLAGSSLVCQLEQRDGGGFHWEADCDLGGVWEANNLVRQLGQFPKPGFGGALCAGDALYQTFRDRVCGQVDMVYSGRAGATTPCDALSMGVHWHAKQALIGDVYETSPVINPCAIDPAVDPANDCCDNTGTLGPQPGKCGWAGP